MKIVEPTLLERAGRMYRRLLILQRLFHHRHESDEGEAIGGGDRARDAAFSAAISEVLDELTEHAEVLTSIPFPIGEWQAGNGPDDERWRAVTEVERREMLSMLAGYERLISWAEQNACGSAGVADRVEPAGGRIAMQPPADVAIVPQRCEAKDYLSAERTRVGRFRQEMSFLERRRSAG